MITENTGEFIQLNDFLIEIVQQSAPKALGYAKYYLIFFAYAMLNGI